MNAIATKDQNIQKIVRVITKMTQPAQIIWFGSRVRGTAHRYSDYDIALAGVKMDIRAERRLKEALDETLGIFSVDLIDLDRADAAFRDRVMQTGVVVYEI